MCMIMILMVYNEYWRIVSEIKWGKCLYQMGKRLLIDWQESNILLIIISPLYFFFISQEFNFNHPLYNLYVQWATNKSNSSHLTIVLSSQPQRNSYVKAKMSHQTTPNHKRDTVICPLSTSPNSMLLADLPSTTKINPLPLPTLKSMSTPTTLKKNDPCQSKTKKWRSPPKISMSNGNLPTPSFRHKPKLNSVPFHMPLTVSFLTRNACTYLAVRHRMAKHQVACSDWTSIVCNGRSRNKRVQLPKLEKRLPCHFTPTTKNITWCFTEAPIMKPMNCLVTSTYTLLKASAGSNAITSRQTSSSPDSPQASVSTITKFTCSEGITWMPNTTKAILMTCTKLSLP